MKSRSIQNIEKLELNFVDSKENSKVDSNLKELNDRLIHMKKFWHLKKFYWKNETFLISNKR